MHLKWVTDENVVFQDICLPETNNYINRTWSCRKVPGKPLVTCPGRGRGNLSAVGTRRFAQWQTAEAAEEDWPLGLLRRFGLTHVGLKKFKSLKERLNKHEQEFNFNSKVSIKKTAWIRYSVIILKGANLVQLKQDIVAKEKEIQPMVQKDRMLWYETRCVAHNKRWWRKNDFMSKRGQFQTWFLSHTVSFDLTCFFLVSLLKMFAATSLSGKFEGKWVLQEGPWRSLCRTFCEEYTYIFERILTWIYNHYQ